MSLANWHISEDRLELYALGRLRDLDLDHVEDHLLLCEGCRERLEVEESYTRAIKSALLRDFEVRESFWTRLRDAFSTPAPRWAAAMGVVAIFGIALQFPRIARNPSEDNPVTVRLEAMKGDTGTAIADRPLALVLDARGLPAATYRLEIVNQRGNTVWQSSAIAEEENLRTLVTSRLGSGRYFVRVYATGLVREFALRVR